MAGPGQPPPTGPRPTGSPTRPVTGGNPAASGMTSRPFVSLAGPPTGTIRSTEALPPPPWAAQGSATLKPLPHQTTPSATPQTVSSMTSGRWLAVVLVLLIAAVLGFLAIRGVHDVLSGIIVGPADTGSFSLSR
jgi:hypothetical protein